MENGFVPVFEDEGLSVRRIALRYERSHFIFEAFGAG
jgi:hypothetical protein